jgi:thiol-disulfide isomerase/thioredoxin
MQAGQEGSIMADTRESTKTNPGGAVPARRRNRLGAIVWTAAVAALMGFTAIYLWLSNADNAGRARAPDAGTQAGATASATSPGSMPAGPGANPLSKGQVAGFVFKASPEPMPEVSFVDGEGKPKTLADWTGRTVLLNLWATWCAPCRKEMPALDRLQKALGSDRFEVVALAIDRGGIAKAKAFLDEIKVEHLKLYVDPTAKLTAPFKVIGLPTTILVKNGKEIGRLVGPAEWDAPEAQKLIQAVMAK